MKTILCMAVAFCLVSAAVMALRLDIVDIGNSTQESTHNATGWLPYTAGAFGGRDSNESIATVWGDGGFCNDANKDATVQLDAGFIASTSVKVRHYDGLSNDGFDVYVNGAKIGSYTDQYNSEGAEQWKTTYFPVTFTGAKNITLVASGIASATCAYTNEPVSVGQVAVNWIELEGSDGNDTDQYPEFSHVAGAVAVAGAIAGLLAMRRH